MNRCLETIIEVDEAAMERYFEGTVPSDDEMAQLIIRAVAQGCAYPDRLHCLARPALVVPELIQSLGLVRRAAGGDCAQGQKRRRRRG